MTRIANLAGQLFHSAGASVDYETDSSDYVTMLLSGRLTLAPHTSQQVGPEFDWSADPLEDANWRFQYQSLVWLDRLRDESMKTESVQGIELYERLLISWIRANPVSAPASDYSWFDMAVGVRAIVLLFAVEHFGEQDWLVASIRTHGEQLADADNYEGRGNHSLHQDMGLLAVAQYLDEPEWVSLAELRIHTMFSVAVDSQGVSREGSVDYHYLNYRWYLEAAKRLEAATGRVPSHMLLTLETMPEFLAHATSPSGKYAMLGDTVQREAPAVPGTSADWLTDESKAPVARSKVFDAGYIFARSSWRPWEVEEKTSYLSLRFGPGRATAVHGHEDAGSLTLSAGGEDLICDSGLYAYEAGAYRVHFRGRSSHNVVDVEGRKYYSSADSPLVTYEERGNHVLATVLVKGLQGVSWHRTLVYSLTRGYVLVDDRVSNTPSSEVLQRWQLPRDSDITWSGPTRNVLIETQRKNRIQFTQLAGNVIARVAEGSESPIAGWRSDRYREKYATPELSFSLTGESVRFSTLIQVSHGDEEDVAQVTAFERTGKLLRIELSAAGWTDTLAISSTEFSAKEECS